MTYQVVGTFNDYKGKSNLEVALKLRPVEDIETKAFPGLANFSMFILMALFAK